MWLGWVSFSGRLPPREPDIPLKQTAGDVDGCFGTHQPAVTFDNQASAASFNVTSGYLNANTKGAAWIVLNDSDPDATNAVPPASDALFRIGVPLAIRTRLEYLSSLTTGEAAAGGVLFGLSSADTNSDTGWLARVERVPGTNTGRLYLDAFVDGARGSNVVASANFSYGNFDALWFSTSGSPPPRAQRSARSASLPTTRFSERAVIRLGCCECRHGAAICAIAPQSRPVIRDRQSHLACFRRNLPQICWKASGQKLTVEPLANGLVT